MNISSKLKRVKAQADHLFLRGERTDVVGDLRTAEDQADNLKVLCEALKTAIEKTLHTHNTPEEKRIRKVNESHGAEALKDALHQLSVNSSSDQQPDQPLPNNTLLRDIVEQAAESQQGLSLEVLYYDKRIEEEVLRPLTTILQRDFSNWSKLRKQLKQVGQELDAARSRFRNSSSSSASGAVSATTAARADTLKEEMEEAESRLDLVKDNYACELFLLLSKERELCELVERFLQIRQDRFIKSQSLLSTVLPKLERQLACSSTGPVYGIRLDQHLKLAQKKVAVPIEVCLRRLAEVGIQEEGLFRMAGSATKVKRLRGAFDANLVDAATFVSAGDEYHRDYDVHVLAGTFKLYLRELPEPLLTYTLHAEWLEAARTPDRDEKLRKLWSAVKKLPGPNFDNLSFVIQFLSLLASHQSHNKMTPNNIAIVIAPNLIWSPEDNKQDDVMGTLGRNMSLGTLYRQIVEQLVECSDYFFGGDVIDFGVPRGVLDSTEVSGNSVLNGSMPHVSGIINNLGGGGGQQQPSYVTLPRGHNRNRSADFKLDSSLSGITFDNKFQADASCESPKHPQRRKKQAPLPPQGSGGSSGTNDNSQGNSSSSSPEQPRSHPPPRSEIPAPIPPFSRTYPALPVVAASAPIKPPPLREGPTPPVATARLHHTGSIRRPNIEPPKPPVPSVGIQQPQPRTEKPLQQIPVAVPGLVSGTAASSHLAHHDRVESSGTSAGVGSSCRSPPPRPQPPSSSAVARGVMTATTSDMSASVESSSMSSSSLSSDGPPSAPMTESGGSVTAPQQRSHVESSSVIAAEGRGLEGSSKFSVGHHPSPIISAANTGFGTSSPAGDSQHLQLKPPIGFEHFDDTLSPASVDIEMPGNAVVYRNKNLNDSSEVFTREGLQEGDEYSPSNLLASSKNFRKSLENVIQQQASGQPLVLPRHQVVDSSSANNNSTEENVDFRESPVQDPNAITGKDDGTALEHKEEVNKVGFPVPAVRSSKEAMQACVDRPEPASRSDKPALPEKPSTLPRPAVPDRPPLAPRPSSNPPTKPIQGVSTAASEPADPSDDAGEDALERRPEGGPDEEDVAGRDHIVESLSPEHQSTFSQAKKKSNNNNTCSNSATGNNISTSITNKINSRRGGATKTVIYRKITPHFTGRGGVDSSLRQDGCGSERTRSNTMSSSLESDMIGDGEDTDRRQRSRSGGSITANASGKCISPGDILGEEKNGSVGGGSKVSQRIQAFAEKSLPSQNISDSPPYHRSKNTTTTDVQDKTSVGVRKSIHSLQDQLFRDSTLQRARDGQCIIQKKKVSGDSISSFTSTMDRPSTKESAAATLLSRSLENLDQVTSLNPINDTTAQTGRVASSISRSSLHGLGNKRLTSRNSGEGTYSGRRVKSHGFYGSVPRNASFDQLLDESPSRFTAGLAPPPPQFRDCGSEDSSSSSTAADDDDAVWQKRNRRAKELRKEKERSSSGERCEAVSNSNNASPYTKRSSKEKNFPPPAQQEQQSPMSFTPSRVAPKPPLAPKGSVVARTTSPNSRPSGESVANSTDF